MCGCVRFVGGDLALPRNVTRLVSWSEVGSFLKRFMAEGAGQKYIAPKDRIVGPLDVLEFGSKEKEVYYVGTSGQKVTVMKGLESAPLLERVCLRANLIRQISSYEKLQLLTSLELPDNKIQSIPDNLAQTCPALTNLDLSYNAIREFGAAVQQLSNLQR